MSGKSTKTKLEEKTLSTGKIKELETPYIISCACCNQDINGTGIGIIYYGTMIHLCGSPCGVSHYLDTQ
jgi:hypothetical protein